MKKNIMLYSALSAIIGAILLIITTFIPFASAKDEYKENLMNYPDSIYLEEVDMTNKDAVSISLVEFVKIDSVAVEIGVSEETAIANMVVIIAFCVFAVLTLLFSILRKPIAILIFDIISFLAMQLIKYDFKDRGIIPSNSYDWGVAPVICYISIVIIAVSAVLLLIAKIKNKKAAAVSK